MTRLRIAPLFWSTLLLLPVVDVGGAQDAIPLHGRWGFALDSDDRGVSERWFDRSLPGAVDLPGALGEQGIGDEVSVETRWTGTLNDRSWFDAERYAPYREPGNVKVPFWLQPLRHYVGAAWYQRWVDTPAEWEGKRVVLSLERPHWATSVWVDGRHLGSRDSLSTPHRYDLGTRLLRGRHRITIRVDNRVLVPVGVNAHSVSDHTQGNWNGIVGGIVLRATPPLWIDRVEIHPDVSTRRIRVRTRIGNATGRPGRSTLLVRVERPEGAGSSPASEARVPVEWSRDGGAVEFEHALGEGARLWDEFQPALHRLHLRIAGQEGGRVIPFGMREIRAVGRRLVLNGRKIFLRGTLECCIFPRHGYPPADVESWRRILGVARAHGLNHLRFHSWCPPEAAFVVADEMGFYYQVESAAWSHSFHRGTRLDTWIYEETDRILEEYGNHPSFVLLAPSNEPGGPDYQRFLARFVEHYRGRDPRRLYTAGSGWPAIPENEFDVTPRARGYPVRATGGETAGDYRAFLSRQTRPVVSHEIGQYCVFPDLDEIAKYTGVFRARNFEIVRDLLRAGGMSDQARPFLLASGRLQTLFYKAEIEACLRTRGWAGFQLLDLHDFPGQGTALVGVLDAFWEEKGYVTPDEYRRFCDETVPLARLEKRVWTDDERLEATVDVAHFGARDLRPSAISWRLVDRRDQVLAEGRFPDRTLPTGDVTTVGRVAVDLGRVPAPSLLRLEVEVESTRFANDWRLWVYPREVDTRIPSDVVVARALDEEAVDALARGGRVLLLPDPRSVRGRTRGRFDPIFWNKLWFPTQPQHTLGLLVDPEHPALAAFPTAYHSDWQWQDLHNRSRPLVLDGLSGDLRPVVQVIDDWNTCRKLGLVVEARAGGGRLMICSIDLESDLATRPAARQLRSSLLAYASSGRFAPRVQLSLDDARGLFRDLSFTEKVGARVVRVDSQQRGYEGARALDGDPSTMWHTAWGDDEPGFPHEIVIRCDRPAPLAGMTVLPRQDRNRNGWIRDYEVHVSGDGEDWGAPVARGRFRASPDEKEISFPRPLAARWIRLRALGSFDDQPFASIAEIWLLPGGPSPVKDR